ncbi:MAG TPA: DUF1016 N-terminal domain-containing protein [Arthrobacter sp.]|jgi:predicted nuclease of restriction endonuclease-like (RecB) superfamily|uniref:DUF1016 N-terminal domain-containing protein n=1 Tax=Arthrobacter sp. TaxID=1667 RepID=UPI002F3F0D4C
MASSEIELKADYAELLEALKTRTAGARVQAQRTVNTLVIELYSSLGKDVIARQASQGWGIGVIRRLAADLAVSFPDMKGLSYRNLEYMTAMVRAWDATENVPQRVALLPWGHIRMILDKAAIGKERDWYAAAAVQYGWSRNVLLNMMMNHSMERTGAAPSNFTRQLAAAESELSRSPKALTAAASSHPLRGAHG